MKHTEDEMLWKDVLVNYFSQLKEHRHIATRDEKIARNYKLW